MSLVPPAAASRPVPHNQILSPFTHPAASAPGTLLQHPLIGGWIDMSSAFAHGGSQNVTTTSAFARPAPAPFAPAGPRTVVPAKRSDNHDDDDDDLQFISAQPVKKRKIAGSTKYQLKVTPPAAAAAAPSPPRLAPHADGFWRLPEEPVAGQVQSRAQDQGKNGDLAQERRVSTGMVGLLSDMPEIEAAVAMRGVSLPSLESYVFGQSPRRPRPMASPPLSPKQLPSNFQPWALNSPLTRTPADLHTIPPPAADAMDEDTIMLQAPMVTVSPSSHAVNPDLSRASSPAQDTSIDRHMTSMPAPISSHTQHEQIPDSPRQIPPSHPNMPPAGAARAHGAKQPCRICIQMAQREALARAQGLPLAMVGPPMPTHAMPQMHGPPIPPYPHLHHQLASMPTTSIQGLGSGYLPMVMPMHQFNGILSHGSSTQPPLQLTSPQLAHPVPKAKAAATPPQTPARTGESSLTTLSAPKPRPGTPQGPFKPPASLIQPTYRKPSPNLIVDVAETCQERFPFEEVAERHKVPVDKVIEVFAAIIQVPLLRCPTDRRRPGKLATSRVKEYARARKAIREERGARAEGGVSGSRGEATASPLEIAQRLGPVELPEEFEMPAQRDGI